MLKLLRELRAKEKYMNMTVEAERVAKEKCIGIYSPKALEENQDLDYQLKSFNFVYSFISKIKGLKEVNRVR